MPLSETVRADLDRAALRLNGRQWWRAGRDGAIPRELGEVGGAQV